MHPNKKILLASTGLLSLDRPPSALAFLAGVCNANNVSYCVFDLNVFLHQYLGNETWNLAYSVLPILHTEENHSLLEKIKSGIQHAVESEVFVNSEFDTCAVTLFSYQQILITQLFLQALREKFHFEILIGGPGVSYQIESDKTVGKWLLEQKLVDYYILGEGDYVFDNFLKNKIDLGVNYESTALETWAIQIDNLDNCIVPTFKDFDFGNYDFETLGDRELPITGSRGCVRRCTFCDVGHIWKKFRFRSAKHIIQEICQHHKETGITNFVFTDSLINGSLKQFTDLMTQLSDEQFTKYKFKFKGQFIIRPSTQHPEHLFALMASAGFDILQIGIESGSDQLREHMGKKFSNSDIDYHLEMCSKYRIKNTFLMMTGYPTETLWDHNQTVKMMRDYQKYLINDTIINMVLAQPFALLKNTPLDKMKVELGIHDENYTTHLFKVSTNPELTVTERFRRYIELKKLMIELNYPNYYQDLTGIRTQIDNLKNSNHVVEFV